MVGVTHRGLTDLVGGRARHYPAVSDAANNSTSESDERRQAVRAGCRSPAAGKADQPLLTPPPHQWASGVPGVSGQCAGSAVGNADVPPPCSTSDEGDHRMGADGFAGDGDANTPTPAGGHRQNLSRRPAVVVAVMLVTPLGGGCGTLGGGRSRCRVILGPWAAASMPGARPTAKQATDRSAATPGQRDFMSGAGDSTGPLMSGPVRTIAAPASAVRVSSITSRQQIG